MTTTQKPDMLLWLSDARGVYIPRDFANSFADRAKHVTGVKAEDWTVLEAGPDHEWYWESWQAVCDNARVTDDKGNVFFVHQDGDCWLVPVGMEWSDENDCFQWPAEDDDAAEADSSAVFHRATLDESCQANFSKPWIFETDNGNQCFDTEAEACAAQRQHRTDNGFDPMTGLTRPAED